MSTAAALHCQVSLSVGTSALKKATVARAVKVLPRLSSVRASQTVGASKKAGLSSSFVSTSNTNPFALQGRALSSNISVKSAAGVTMAASGSAYEFKVKDIDGKEQELSKYKGKVSLIVNVASACGLTKQNYQELTNVYDKLKDKDFEVLAFPCNQFGGQEPGSAEEIKKFAGDKYGAKYPLFSKVDVNGGKAEPLFKYLKEEAGGGDIGWNFGKFLVDKDGKVVKRFDPRTNPAAIEKEIEQLL